MYCINCGVKLADTENKCPLCGTVPYHPDIQQKSAEKLYPINEYPKSKDSKLFQIILTAMFLIPLVITVLCDLRISGSITWSGYVAGALAVGYVTVALPLWFKKPNPVIFTPCVFLSAGLYLLYINQIQNGDWFLSFAFPIVGFIGIVTTTVVTLFKYLRRGRLFVVSGGLLALSLFMPFIEFLLMITFDFEHLIGWSVYPFSALFIIGMLLMIIAISRPLRETFERKFFI